MSSAADEAILRAKAIAARLAATSSSIPSTAEKHSENNGVKAVLDAAFTSQQTDQNFGGATSNPSGKRKRWGIDGNTAPAANGEEGDSSSFVSDALAMALSAEANKRVKEEASSLGGTSTNEVVKRVWIPVDKNPGYNYIGLLIGPGGSKQRQLIEESGGHVRISIRGRGSASANATPGKPEEPLHVLLEGKAENVHRAEDLVNELLNDSAKAQAEKDRQLAQVNAAKNEASEGGASYQSTYTPKTVAQLLGIGGPSTQETERDNNIELFEEKIGVPNGLVGFIIGKGGESITTMQRKSGAKVQIQKEHEMEPGATMRIITLIGPSAESVAACREIIEGMVQERSRMNTEHQQQRAATSGFSSSAVGLGGPGSNAASQASQLQQALALGHFHLQFQVPNSDVGLVIGRGGSTIKTIQERTGANVQIPPQPDENNPLFRTINITHPLKEQAEMTRYYIAGVLSKNTEVMQQLGLASNTPGYGNADYSVQVQVPDKDVGMCIGRAGCVIRELQQRTKTRIQIPPSVPGQEYRIITITGPPEGCAKIQEIMNRIVMEQSSAFVMTGECFQPTIYPYGQQTAAYGQYYQQAYATSGATSAQADYSAQWAAYYASMNQTAGAAGVVVQPTTAGTVSTSVNTAATVNTLTSGSQGQSISPDAYYDAFFQYAYHYGEDKARQYYGAWSPPVGTPNPYGANPALAQEAFPSTA